MRTLTLVLCLVASPVRADILTVLEQGNTPMPRQEAAVSMDSETVHIRPGGNGFLARCTFQMRSHAKEVLTRKMAFPVVDPRYAGVMKEDFHVEIDEGGKRRRVATRVKMTRTESSWAEEFYFEPDHAKFNYPGFVVWDVTWLPGETKTIHVSYDMGAARTYSGIVDGWSLLYVVRTGALWKGPIGKAEISIEFGKDVPSHRTSATPLILSYPKQARWVSTSKVRWRFSRWEPTEDIRVTSLGWVGLTREVKRRFFYALPHPYRGDSARYTVKYLDELVEKELAPWREAFPRRVKKLDRRALRRLIADWLYHEILARHGDPFLVGKAGPNGEIPKGAVMTSAGYAYSEWHTNFQAYMYHGGWYRPRLGPKGTVRPADLKPMERQNLAFLKGQR